MAIRSAHIALNEFFACNPCREGGKKYSGNIGNYKAKKVEFKTCAIIALTTALENRMKIDNIDIQATIEKAQAIIPGDHWKVNFTDISDNSRKLTITCPAGWSQE